MIRAPFALMAAMGAATLVAGCIPARQEPAPVVQRGPGASAAPTQDARGVIFFPDYEVMVARPGDSVEAMAARVGISGSALASYNGLPVSYQPRAGDELVLPPRDGGYRGGGGGVFAAAPATPVAPAPTSSIEASPLGAGAPLAQPPAASPATGPAPAPAAGGSATSVWSPALAAGAIARASGAEPAPAPQAAPQQATGDVTAAAPAPLPQQAPAAAPVETVGPISAGAPAPAPAPETTVVAIAPQAQSTPAPAPAPAAPAAAPASSARFLPPVNGPVLKPFSRAPGAGRNDGIDFASPAGTPVTAAADGEVALVSRSLGGLGTIVLIRHDAEFLTVYGKVDAITVAKGDRIARGQPIGVVAATNGSEPSVHFEVRQGARSVDPAGFF